MNDSERIIQELEDCPFAEGATMAAILDLSEPLRMALTHMVRSGPLPRGQVCETFRVEVDAVDRCIELLVEKGFVEEITPEGSEPVYQVALVPVRGKPIADDL